MRKQAQLIYAPDTSRERTFTLVDEIVVGRRRSEQREELRQRIVIPDKRVSSRHCLINQTDDGRFFLRDVSRNGTKIDGRRVLPNIEVELQHGCSIQIGSVELMLWIDDTEHSSSDTELSDDVTEAACGETPASILVGDIAGYTSLNQRYSPTEVLSSVNALFSALAELIVEHHGTVKEYQGDAVLAFWEGELSSPHSQALAACEAALHLAQRVTELAQDPEIWRIRDFPLKMEWAITSGMVTISSLGGDRPTGLALVGDAVNYAFRLEKLANSDTGTILICHTTYLLAKQGYDFHPLDRVKVEGRSYAEPIYSLLGRRTTIPHPLR